MRTELNEQTYVGIGTTETVSYGPVDPHDSWDRPNEYWDISFDNVGLIDKTTYPGDSVLVHGDVEVGDTLYVVAVTYSTGDTFGRNEGCKSLEFASTDREMAEKVEQAIPLVNLRWSSDRKLNNSEKWLEKNNIDLSMCWCGYFESLDGTEILEIKVVG